MHAKSLVECKQVVLDQVGVQLDLVHYGFDAGVRPEVNEHLHIAV